MTIKWSDNIFRRNLEQLKGKYPATTTTALKEQAIAIKERAQELAPVDTGDLRDSAVVDEAVISDGKVVIGVGFLAEYADAVHEDPAQPNRKFLERAIEEIGSNLLSELAKSIDGGLG